MDNCKHEMVECSNCGEEHFCNVEPWQKRIEELKQENERLQKALQEIHEVANARIIAKVAYTSGNMQTDNAVYFRIAEDALKRYDEEAGK